MSKTIIQPANPFFNLRIHGRQLFNKHLHYRWRIVAAKGVNVTDEMFFRRRQLVVTVSTTVVLALRGVVCVAVIWGKSGRRFMVQFGGNTGRSRVLFSFSFYFSATSTILNSCNFSVKCVMYP